MEVFEGGISESINEYLSTKGDKDKLQNLESRTGNGFIKFNNIDVYGIDPHSSVVTGAPLNLAFSIENLKNISLERTRFDFRIDDTFGQRIFWFSSVLKDIEKSTIPSIVTINIPKCVLNSGDYLVTVFCSVDNSCADWGRKRI